MKSKVNYSALYLLFFITGAAGLVYQVLWSRMFGLVFGNTTFASSTVLAAFMAGLALGSYYSGRFFSEKAVGLKTYAFMELLVGIFGILMPIIVTLLSIIYSSTYKSFHPSFIVLTIIRFTLSFFVMVIPCTFMGATLPVLCKYLANDINTKRSIIGRLYGVNTIGAFIGCALSGFIFVGEFGVIKTSIIAGLMNFAVAVIAYLFATKVKGNIFYKKEGITTRGRSIQQDEIKINIVDSKSVDSHGKGQAVSRVLIIMYALSGFAALALEVSWTKAMVWIMSMDSYAFAAMLSIILIGIGAGSLIYSFISKKIKNETRFLSAIQFFIGITVLFSITVIQNSVIVKQIIENILNGSVFLKSLSHIINLITLSQFLISASVLLVPSILMGLSFPLFTNMYLKLNTNIGRSVGNIYSANTFGGILGSLLMGFVILPAIGLLPSIALMAGIFILNSLVLFMIFSSINMRRRITRTAILLVVAITMIFFTDLNFQDYLNTTLNRDELHEGEKLIYFKEQASGSVMIKESKAYGKEMLVDGVQVASDGDFDLHSHIYPAHLMSLLKKDPKDILVVAFGCGGTSGSILKYDDVNRLDVVEIADGVVSAAKTYFSKMNSGVFQNPKLNIIIQDGKNYISMTDKKYDIIYSGPIHPQSNQGSAALYTKDYFQDCKTKLKSDGFQCLWLPMHMSSPEDFKIIVKTFMEVYPYVSMWDLPQTDTSVAHPHLIGSMEPVYPDYKIISEKLKKPGILEDINRLNETSFSQPYQFISQFMMGEDALKRFVGNITTLNTDDLPVVEFYKRPSNYLVSTAASKAKLLADTAEYMENPYQYVQNVPEDEKIELKKKLDTLYEGNKNLIMGHYYLTAKQIIQQNVDKYILDYYNKAYELIPDSLYLKKYLSK